MTLYFVRHHHEAERCPARDSEAGKMLLEHLTVVNARRYGVDLLADAVLDGKHTLVLIAEAEDPAYVRDFMQPFAQAGTVDIDAASTCEAVVERHGCDPVPAGQG
jgi:hypothetical protein